MPPRIARSPLSSHRYRRQWRIHQSAMSTLVETAPSAEQTAPSQPRLGQSSEAERMSSRRPRRQELDVRMRNEPNARTIIVRVWDRDDIGSMAHAFAIVREIERKFGPLREYRFSRDFEVHSRYNPYFFADFDSPESLNSMGDTANLEVPIPRADPTKMGNLGLDDIQDYLRTTPSSTTRPATTASSPARPLQNKVVSELEANSESVDETDPTAAEPTEPDETVVEPEVIHVRLERAFNRRPYADVYAPRPAGRDARRALAHAFLSWGGFSNSTLAGTSTASELDALTPEQRSLAVNIDRHRAALGLPIAPPGRNGQSPATGAENGTGLAISDTLHGLSPTAALDVVMGRKDGTASRVGSTTPLHATTVQTQAAQTKGKKAQDATPSLTSPSPIAAAPSPDPAALAMRKAQKAAEAHEFFASLSAELAGSKEKTVIAEAPLPAVSAATMKKRQRKQAAKVAKEAAAVSTPPPVGHSLEESAEPAESAPVPGGAKQKSTGKETKVAKAPAVNPVESNTMWASGGKAEDSEQDSAGADDRRRKEEERKTFMSKMFGWIQ